jgi:transcriptional/translational regulatory protein YebC/TACO1
MQMVEVAYEFRDQVELFAASEEQNIPMASAEVTMIPQTYVTLTDEADITNIGRILDFLDDDDDVQEVYHNWEE